MRSLSVWFRKAVRRDSCFLKGNSLKRGSREDKVIVCNCISIDLPSVITGLTPPAGLSPAFNEITLRDKAVGPLNGGWKQYLTLG